MILENKEQFVTYVPTANNAEWLDMETHRDSAERWLKNEILGNVLYKDILIELNSPEFVDVVDCCRKIISLDAYQRAIPFLDVVQTANGFGVISNPNCAPASRDRVNRLLSEVLKQRDEEIEVLLDLLEDTPVLHDAWKGSNTYSIISECWIWTARELKRLCQWNGSREDFLKLKPVLLLTMYNNLGRWVGREFVDELVEQQRDGELLPANKVVLDLLKVVLANYVVDNVKDADKLRDEVITLMDNNVNDYPTYASSAMYRLRSSKETVNEKDSPVFFMGGI